MLQNLYHLPWFENNYKFKASVIGLLFFSETCIFKDFFADSQLGFFCFSFQQLKFYGLVENTEKLEVIGILRQQGLSSSAYRKYDHLAFSLSKLSYDLADRYRLLILGLAPVFKKRASKCLCS